RLHAGQDSLVPRETHEAALADLHAGEGDGADLLVGGGERVERKLAVVGTRAEPARDAGLARLVVDDREAPARQPVDAVDAAGELQVPRREHQALLEVAHLEGRTGALDLQPFARDPGEPLAFHLGEASLEPPR